MVKQFDEEKEKMATGPIKKMGKQLTWKKKCWSCQEIHFEFLLRSPGVGQMVKIFFSTLSVLQNSPAVGQTVKKYTFNVTPVSRFRPNWSWN